MTDSSHIVVAGAGSIGCYLGGLLVADGRRVTLLVRDRIAAELGEHGLHLTSLDGLRVDLAPEQLSLTTDSAVLGTADLILVTVKGTALEDMGRVIATHAPPSATVVSLQNGVGSAQRLRAFLPRHCVLAGTVSFNVLQLGEGRFHRGTTGPVVIEAGDPSVTAVLDVPHLELETAADMVAVQWGKLLLNLNNALNALAGLPLHNQLLDRRWRRVLAQCQDEALAVLDAAGIRPWSMGPLPARLLPRLLRLPTPLFRLFARSSVRIDRQARSSMWEDLDRRRPTEVDELQGAVVGLAAEVGRQAPVNARVRKLVKQAEAAGHGSPRLSPDQVAETRG